MPTPRFYYSLPHRTKGSFGVSPLGRVLEWATTSWMKFNISVIATSLAVFSILALPQLGERAILILVVSPLLASFIYVLLRIAFIVGYFLPGISMPLGWIRLGYIWLFSRLVAEAAPAIDLPIGRTRTRVP